MFNDNKIIGLLSVSGPVLFGAGRGQGAGDKSELFSGFFVGLHSNCHAKWRKRERDGAIGRDLSRKNRFLAIRRRRSSADAIRRESGSR